MAERKQNSYRCQPIAELARQLRKYAPVEKRREEVRRTEDLHDQINPAQNYPLDFIQFRITGYHNESETEDATILVGDAILPDLRQLIDELSKSVGMPVSKDDPAHTADELAEQLGINPRTLSRWRKQGLRWRWLILPGSNRKRLGFTPKAVDVFRSQHEAQFETAENYSRLDDETRAKLIVRARRLVAHEGITLNKVAAHLAKRTGRALQTIRSLLEKHDEDHPDDKIFPEHDGPLTDQQKRVICREHRHGKTVASLCREYGRTRSTIYRVIAQRRAAVLARLKLPYVFSKSFEDDGYTLKPLPGIVWLTIDEITDDDLPAGMAVVYRAKPVTAQRRRDLLLQYNFLKYRAAKMRAALDPYAPASHEITQIESDIRNAVAHRDCLITLSLPIVLSTARQQLVGRDDAGPNRLMELLLLGNEVLYQSVDEFDPTRMQTFGAFVTWRLQRAFAQVTEDDGAHRRAHRRMDVDRTIEKIYEQASAYKIHLPQPAAMC